MLKNPFFLITCERKGSLFDGNRAKQHAGWPGSIRLLPSESNAGLRWLHIFHQNFVANKAYKKSRPTEDYKRGHKITKQRNHTNLTVNTRLQETEKEVALMVVQKLRLNSEESETTSLSAVPRCFRPWAFERRCSHEKAPSFGAAF